MFFSGPLHVHMSTCVYIIKHMRLVASEYKTFSPIVRGDKVISISLKCQEKSSCQTSSVLHPAQRKSHV